MHTKAFFSALAGFLVLFACYHAAEFWILFEDSAPGFLLCSALFFIAAYLIAKMQARAGLSRWGLAANRRTALFGITELLIGLVVYGTAFLLRLLLKMEVIDFVPDTVTFLKTGTLLVFGSFVSSLTEDVLTRAYVFAHLRNSLKPALLILVSAAVYTLNHIYRLNEPVYLVFIFLTGIHLAIPLLLTRNIWYTVGMHWAGNIVYHLTSNVMHTADGPNPFPSLVFMLPFLVLLIPINIYICKKLVKQPRSSFFSMGHSPVHHPASVIRPD